MHVIHDVKHAEINTHKQGLWTQGLLYAVRMQPPIPGSKMRIDRRYLLINVIFS